MIDLSFLTGSIYIVVKVGVWIFLFLYVIFSLVIYKQVTLMIETLEVGFEKQIRILSIFNIFISITALIFSFLI